MKELKPCPFCGGRDIKLRTYSASPYCEAICDYCGSNLCTEVSWEDESGEGLSRSSHDERCREVLTELWNSSANIVKREKPKFKVKKALPCPFCGSDSVSVTHSEMRFIGVNGLGIKKIKMKAYCICNKCYARSKPIVYYGHTGGGYRGYSEDFLPLYACGGKAIEAWNRRTDNAISANERED